MRDREPFPLEGYLEGRREAVEHALERSLAWIVPLLPEGVGSAVRHGVLAGGKRLRPILCVAAYEACGGRGEEAAYDLGASLELVHSYSLIHDDLPCMDDAALRRGRPTTHRVYGETDAIRAGAALIPLAALQALRSCRSLGCTPRVGHGVAQALLEAAGAGGMVGGQWLDLQGEGSSLTGDELRRLHALKTGALLAASLRMGAEAAGATREVVGALEAYGRAIGLAFQIRDDLLDATASAEALGKNPSDVALGKSTYVSLYGVADARVLAEREVERALDALTQAAFEAPALVALARHMTSRRS